jgi:outer membrane receptor protein involved in Fe transport
MMAFAAPADTASATAADAGGLQEVIVTANRRAENLQDVPITIQAMSGQQLTQLNVVGFNDLLKYTPNVTFSGNGPGPATSTCVVSAVSARETSRSRPPVLTSRSTSTTVYAVPGT